MVQRGQDLGFALKAGEPFGIVGEKVGEDFDRHVAVELGVLRAIDLAHPAGPEGGENLVRAEMSAGHQSHRLLRGDRIIRRNEPATGRDLRRRSQPLTRFRLACV